MVHGNHFQLGGARRVKKVSGLPSIAYTLVGLLLLSAILLSIGHTDDSTQPAADSYTPSGMRAFAELLQREGYRVEIDQSSRPGAGPGDTVIGFTLEGSGSAISAKVDKTREYIDALEAKGANLIIATLPGDFQKASRAIIDRPPVPITNVITGEKLQVTAAISDDEQPETKKKSGAKEDSAQDASIWLWDADKPGDLFSVSLGRVKRGTEIEFDNGLFLTNRFIDKHDNAALAISVIHAIASPGSKLLFAEGTWAPPTEKGLFATIGTWAAAGYYQSLFLLAVIMFSLGFRFGLPDEVKRTQRGARELLDAVAFTFRRGKHATAALKSVNDRIDREIRSMLRLAIDASRQERDRFLPDEFRETLQQMEVAANEPHLTTDQAMQLVRRAQNQMDALRDARGLAPQ